jgi:hypothetical protein
VLILEEKYHQVDHSHTPAPTHHYHEHPCASASSEFHHCDKHKLCNFIQTKIVMDHLSLEQINGCHKIPNLFNNMPNDAQQISESVTTSN